MTVHIVIPDTQVKPGVPTEHLTWIGRYITAEFSDDPDVTIIHLGDHWDMPSLSAYDLGRKQMEGRRFVADIQAGNAAMTELTRALRLKCRKVLLRGNHEHRITRAAECNPQLDGLLTLDLLKSPGWEVVEFLTPIFIDGIGYVHYWQNLMTGRPLGGTALLRLKTLGHSFVMGHQQTLDIATRYSNGQLQRGVIAGACYLHDEEYKGVQGNHHWRGILIFRHIDGHGGFDVQEVSLDYLERRYGGAKARR